MSLSKKKNTFVDVGYESTHVSPNRLDSNRWVMSYDYPTKSFIIWFDM